MRPNINSQDADLLLKEEDAAHLRASRFERFKHGVSEWPALPSCRLAVQFATAAAI